MKTTAISGIPIRLSLFIIVCFGLAPSLLFVSFQYIDFKRDSKAAKTAYLAQIEQQLKQDVKIDYETCTVIHAIKIKRLKRSVKSVIDMIFNIVKEEYHVHEHIMQPKQIADLIHDQLQHIRVFERGYFFIFSMEGVVKLYPPDFSQEGTIWLNFEDSKGKQVVRDMIHLAETAGEGFMEYTWPVSKDGGKYRKKISYIRFFAPLGWIIGTGDYIEAVEDEIQEEIMEAKHRYNIMGGDATFLLDREGNLLTGKLFGDETQAIKDVKQAIAQISPDVLKSSGDFFRVSIQGKDGNESAMLGFARYYAPWGWIGGKMVSLDELEEEGKFFEKKLTDEMINECIIIFLVLIFAVLFVFMTGKYFAFELKKHMSEFEAFFEKAGREKEQIDLEQVRFKELKTIGRTANAMVIKRVEQQKAIEQANLKLKDANRKLKEMASVDGLTQVANRRFFDKRLEKEWNRAAREKQGITLGMLDIDFFKRYNDTYGHQSGDDCLVKVGAILREAMRRPADLAARYGGEEFVILLPATNLEGGKCTAERIHRQLQALNIPHSGSPLGRVSFSMGLACTIPSPRTSSDYLVALADRALYKAKETRNQIVCASDSHN